MTDELLDPNEEFNELEDDDDPDTELDNDAALADVDFDDDEDDDSDDDEDEESSIKVSGSFLGLEFEDRPKTNRKGRPKRPDIAWESLPEFETIRENPGRDARILVFKGEHAKGRAVARARQIRLRLFARRPLELWDVSHRQDKTDGSYKVFAKYVRVLTPEQSAERIAKHSAAAARLAAAREETNA